MIMIKNKARARIFFLSAVLFLGACSTGDLPSTTDSHERGATTTLPSLLPLPEAKFKEDNTVLVVSPYLPLRGTVSFPVYVNVSVFDHNHPEKENQRLDYGEFEAEILDGGNNPLKIHATPEGWLWCQKEGIGVLVIQLNGDHIPKHVTCYLDALPIQLLISKPTLRMSVGQEIDITKTIFMFHSDGMLSELLLQGEYFSTHLCIVKPLEGCVEEYGGFQILDDGKTIKCSSDDPYRVLLHIQVVVTHMFDQFLSRLYPSFSVEGGGMLGDTSLQSLICT